MRIVFVGAVQFSRRLLSGLVDIEADICGVVCKPGSSFHSDFATLDDLAGGRPLHHTMSLNSAPSVAWLKERAPDAIFCCGWSEILTPQIRSLPPKGVVGYHPTLLPKHRGRHPIIWALALGLTETGSTFFLMDDGTDSGPILDQKVVPIDPADDAGSLYKKLACVAGSQIKNVYSDLAAGTLVYRRQIEADATYWPKRTAKDGMINFGKPTRDIVNLVRALARPYPGATFNVSDQVAVVWRASSVDASMGAPGEVVSADPIVIRTGDGAVRIDEAELPTPIHPGMCL